MIRDLWGDPQSAASKETERRLEWLGHVTWMPNNYTPEMSLFG